MPGRRNPSTPHWKWLAVEIGKKGEKSNRMALMRAKLPDELTSQQITLRRGRDLEDVPTITQLLDRRKVRWEEMKARKSIRPFFENRSPIKNDTLNVARTIHQAATQYRLIGDFLRRWKYIYIDRTGAMTGTNWNIRFLPRYMRLETKKILEGKY